MHAFQTSQSAKRHSAMPIANYHHQFSGKNQRLLRNILNPSSAAASTSVQPSLKIGAANDRYEQEADRMADKVVNTSDSDILSRGQTGPENIQRMCQGCDEELQQKPVSVQKMEEEEESLQAKSNHQQRDETYADDDAESSIRSLKNSGTPLSDENRAFFEPRFGQDFSNVRVHTGAHAEQLTSAINARAFTYGNHIVFANGEFQPDSGAGKHLMGHELTHVVQQGGTKQTPAANQGTNQLSSSRGVNAVQRAEPVTTITFGAIAAKCIIGAIVGVLFDGAIQAALHSWRERSWRFWEVTIDWCSIILSAILGCIAGPISAYALEPWIAAKLGPKLSGVAGTLIGKILLFIAKKLGMAVPKSMVSSLAKLNCISPEQSAELGVPVETIS